MRLAGIEDELGRVLDANLAALYAQWIFPGKEQKGVRLF